MNKTDNDNWFYDWLNLSIEDKYKFDQISYLEKFPQGSISDFHLMEISLLEKQLKKYEENKEPEWHEIKAATERQKLLEYYQRFEMENTHELIPEINLQPIKHRLKWIGTPSQFGFIISELIGKGYLEKPTSSYAKDANLYLEIFDINTTPGGLEKEVNTNSNSLSTDNGRLLIMPNIDKLK